MAKNDYFVIVYGLLKYFYECLKTDTAIDKNIMTAEYWGLTLKYWNFILHSLQEQQYLIGYELVNTIEGEIYKGFENSSITVEGIQYLFENELFEKAKKALKDVPDKNGQMKSYKIGH